MPLDATPILRRYARLRQRALVGKDPRRVLERELLRLVRQAADTRFGRVHGFASICSVAEFQARVPLRFYEDFWSTYFEESFPLLDDIAWPGRMPYFAVSSGTASGRTKHIPVSRAMIRSTARQAPTSSSTTCSRSRAARCSAARISCSAARWRWRSARAA
jgi:hypothetical protein